MKTKKIYDLIASNNINVPLYIYRNIDNFKLDHESLLFLMYINSFGSESVFNPGKYSEDLNIGLNKVLELVTKLTDIKLIEINAVKNNKGIMEEVISLKLFHNKLFNYLIDGEDDKEENTNIYSKIEQEFGRVLTPIEYEIINAWIESKYSEELINEALKEAVYNGVSNLRYIDKILYEWNKKGYKNKQDIERSREKWKNKENRENKAPKPKKEVFDYNWLEDDKDE